MKLRGNGIEDEGNVTAIKETKIREVICSNLKYEKYETRESE
jgi:hypothetical protein